MLRIIFKTIFISLLIFSLVKCDSYEFPKSPYPRVETLPVISVSETSVTFQANISQMTNQPIIRHGFNWGLSDRLINENENIELGATSTKKFDATVNVILKKGDVYLVRAFVATEDYIVYGKAITFTR